MTQCPTLEQHVSLSTHFVRSAGAAGECAGEDEEGGNRKEE